MISLALFGVLLPHKPYCAALRFHAFIWLAGQAVQGKLTSGSRHARVARRFERTGMTEWKVPRRAWVAWLAACLLGWEQNSDPTPLAKLGGELAGIVPSSRSQNGGRFWFCLGGGAGEVRA